MERSNRIGWAQVRAGVFIFVTLVFIVGGVTLMGQKSKMFVPKGKLRVVMDDVVGLKEGAPVWLAGRANTVNAIALARNCMGCVGPIMPAICDWRKILAKKGSLSMPVTPLVSGTCAVSTGPSMLSRPLRWGNSRYLRSTT